MDVFQAGGDLGRLLSSDLSRPMLLPLVLGSAFFFGAAHGLTPGHGKAVLAAYLVGSRGRVREALYLGAVITITHTASVFSLGLLVLLASWRMPLELIFPWAALVSALLVTLVGASLWRERSRHSHETGHEHHHHSGGGWLHQHHTAEGPAVKKSGLVALGISGGLVPCSEALVVLLVSISLRKIGLGLAVLVSFSLGLAAVLIGLGIMAVFFAPALKHSTVLARWQHRLPRISAAIVMGLGVFMTIQAIAEMLGRT